MKITDRITDRMKDILEWSICILIAIILAIIIKYFLVTPTIVQLISMDPTLKNNDRLLLNRWAITTNEEIKRGDIITFEAPTKKMYVKEEVDLENPVAIYNKEINGILKKFSYYVLEKNKVSYIKRAIALPGEHITITENGDVYINNEKLQENYLREGLKTERTGYFYDLTVPEGYVFAMGDNRDHSDDSRVFGCIPIEKIEGKAFFRFWPLDSIGQVK